MLPIDSNNTFVANDPFKGKVSETKRKLKAVSMKTDSLLTSCKNKIAQEKNAATEKPKTM